MMRYCEFCGARLEDSARCTCREAQAEAGKAPLLTMPRTPMTPPPSRQDPGSAPQTPQEPPARPRIEIPIEIPPEVQEKARAAAGEAQEKAKAATATLWQYIKAYFASPAQAVRSPEATEGNTISGLLFVIRVLAAGLAVFGILHKICSVIGASVNNADFSVNAPFLGSLAYGGLIALIGMGLFALAAHIMVQVQKGDSSLRATCQTSVNNGVLVSALLLAAFLLSFVSIRAALACLALAVLASIICGMLTVQIVCPESRTGLFWVVYLIAAAVLLFLGYQIFSKLVLQAMGGITVQYLDQSIAIGSVLGSAAENLNIGNIFSQITNQVLDSLW